MPIREFRFPDLGEGIAEGELLSWEVEPGEAVTQDQTIATVETDKAIVEIPSPVDGTVGELMAAAGDTVPVGTIIATFEVTDDDRESIDDGPAAEPGRRDGSAGPATEPGPALEPEQASPDEIPVETERVDRPGRPAGRIVAPPSVRRLARELDVDLSRVGGTGAGGRITEADVRRAAEGGEPMASDRPEAVTPATGDVPADPDRRGRTLAAPATRRIAGELGVDIEDVPADREYDGSPFVTEDAVREYASARREPAVAEAPEAAAPSRRPAATDAEDEERLPYRSVRRTTGRHMRQSLDTAAHVAHHDEGPVTALVALREKFEPIAEERGVRLTYLPFVMKAVAAALKRHPRFNASLDEEAEEIVLKGYYDIGFAVATNDGLLVPVVEDVDHKSALDIAAEIEELARRARDRTITRAELQGGTFTVTNYGSIGGEFATPIINHPEVAILGVGRLKERPWAVDGSVEATETLRLSLGIDHRVLDGADAARFTDTVLAYLNDPERLLVE